MSFLKTKFWQPYEPSGDNEWNLRRVVHLHRRAGFAANWSEIQRDLKAGPVSAVERLLKGSTGPDSNFQRLSETIGDAAMASGNPARLQAWWVLKMLKSSDPLGERLCLMWHNHFATSNRKVNDLRLMRDQNELFRKHGRAPFGELLHAITKHPAMLVWLDADSNRMSHPNENLARELMELFTVGVGSYSESDVEDAARALTGWSVVEGRYSMKERLHDDGTKTILKTKGNLTGNDLLRLLAEHPSTAKRIAWRLCQTFMGEGVVGKEATEELATVLTNSQLNVGVAVETILRSDQFFSDANIQSRVLGPVEYVIGSLRSLELCDPPPSSLVLADWISRMGQNLFYPPNVGGWNEGRAWLGTRTVIARSNFAHALSEGRLWQPIQEPEFESLADRHGIETGDSKRIEWLATLFWGSAPEKIVDQVKSNTKSSSVVSQLLARPEHQLA